MKTIWNTITDFWRIATSKTPLYEYVLTEIVLRERDKALNCILQYRTVGSRAMEQAFAHELNETDVFARFPPTQAQMIVTIATLEASLKLLENLSPTVLVDKYMGYIKECAKHINSQ